jgi:hypothetical protein|tara:strand:- start:1500 stop:1658 length:159 start_codon:yes stop_codon:yes gene_type:complete
MTGTKALLAERTRDAVCQVRKMLADNPGAFQQLASRSEFQPRENDSALLLFF